MFILTLYSLWCVIQNTLGNSISHIFSFANIKENCIDVIIIVLLVYSFAIKVQDAKEFDIDPNTILFESHRRKHYMLFFLGKNYELFLTIQSISLIFIFLKLINATQYIQKVNNILTTLKYSMDLFMIFFGINILIIIALTPLAQAIWGTYFVGYKNFSYCFTSMLSIYYAKGNLQELLEINFFWSFIFMLLYYSLVIFLNNAAFH